MTEWTTIDTYKAATHKVREDLCHKLEELKDARLADLYKMYDSDTVNDAIAECLDA